MKTFFTLWILAILLICFYKPCTGQYQKSIRVGVILEGIDPVLPVILDKTLHMINRERLLTNRPQIIYHYQNVSQYDSFTASERVCKMLQDDKVVGIIGPESFSASFFMDSMCTFLLVPLIKSIPDFRKPALRESNGPVTAALRKSVNMYPHPRAVGQTLAEYIKDRQWIKELIVIYDNEEALFRLQDVLALNMIRIETQQLDPSGDYKPQLKNIKSTGGFRILLDTSIKNTISFLIQASEVKMISEHYDYIIANWDFYAVDTRRFQNTFVNITGIQFVDSNMTDYAEIKKQIHSIDSYMDGLFPFGIKTEHALFHDAVLTFSKAVDVVLRNEENSKFLFNPTLSCSSHSIKFDGTILINNLQKVCTILISSVFYF